MLLLSSLLCLLVLTSLVDMLTLLSLLVPLLVAKLPSSEAFCTGLLSFLALLLLALVECGAVVYAEDITSSFAMELLDADSAEDITRSLAAQLLANLQVAGDADKVNDDNKEVDDVTIDAKYADNEELAAVEYIEDLYKFYKTAENEGRPHSIVYHKQIYCKKHLLSHYLLRFEIVMTFGLVYTVYATAVDPKKGDLGTIAPIAIGFIEITQDSIWRH